MWITNDKRKLNIMLYIMQLESFSFGYWVICWILEYWRNIGARCCLIDSDSGLNSLFQENTEWGKTIPEQVYPPPFTIILEDKLFNLALFITVPPFSPFANPSSHLTIYTHSSLTSAGLDSRICFSAQRWVARYTNNTEVHLWYLYNPWNENYTLFRWKAIRQLQLMRPILFFHPKESTD